MKEFKDIVDRMKPDEVMENVTAVVKKVFPYISEKARLDFLAAFTGEADPDSVPGLVHLWLATCMDEGVDPKDMCQSLVNKVAQSEQLKAVADPDVLVLFEDWLEELEAEAISAIKLSGKSDPTALGKELGVSYAGASFLIIKLKTEGKL